MSYVLTVDQLLDANVELQNQFTILRESHDELLAAAREVIKAHESASDEEAPIRSVSLIKCRASVEWMKAAIANAENLP